MPRGAAGGTASVGGRQREGEESAGTNLCCVSSGKSRCGRGRRSGLAGWGDFHKCWGTGLFLDTGHRALG